MKRRMDQCRWRYRVGGTVRDAWRLASVSQADVLIAHRLTLRDDIEALEKARPVYVKEPIREAMVRLGTTKGRPSCWTTPRNPIIS